MPDRTQVKINRLRRRRLRKGYGVRPRLDKKIADLEKEQKK